METLAPVVTAGWASGISVYTTVLVTGLAGRYGGLDSVPDVLERPGVLLLAGSLAAVEFVADKIPYVDSAWHVARIVRAESNPDGTASGAGPGSAGDQLNVEAAPNGAASMDVDGELAATGVAGRATAARTGAPRVIRAAAVLTAMATPATTVVIHTRAVLAALHPRRLRGSAVAAQIVRVLGLVTRAAHIAGRVVTTVTRLRDRDSTADADGKYCSNQDLGNRCHLVPPFD